MGTSEKSEDPDEMQHYAAFQQGLHFLLRSKQFSRTEIHQDLEISTCVPLRYIICMGESIRMQRVKE